MQVRKFKRSDQSDLTYVQSFEIDHLEDLSRL